MNTIILNVGNIDYQNILVAVVGITVVFAALSFLYLFFRFIPSFVEWHIKSRIKDKKDVKGRTVEELHLPVGVDAAIGAALYIFLNEMHDEENTVMTIKKISKSYSPWSSKIYAMRWPLK